jgi:hypothetical protein
MPAARVPDDLWRRGRRRYRRRIAGVAAAVLAAALTLSPLVTLTAGPAPAGPAPDGGAVPARVYDPWVWQPPVQQSPDGPAAVLLSGGAFGLQSPDQPLAYGSKLAAVGRHSTYRMLRYGDINLQAGQEVQLSPDGRYVVGPDSIEDLIPDGIEGRLSVVDLTTGHTRRYRSLPADAPVAWQPDGSAVLLWHRPQANPTVGDSPPFDGHEAESGYGGGSLWLLDLASGHTRQVLDLGSVVFDPTNSVAFTPDGRHLLVQLDRQLVLLDTGDGSRRTVAVLGIGQRLAGTGAVSADGSRVAVLTPTGCSDACSNAERNRRQWRLDVLDTATGTALPGPGFDRVTGAAVRVAGWQRDGTAVVVVYRDEENAGAGAAPAAPTTYREVDRADLLALRPGGGTTTLIHPSGVAIWDLDVARDLLVDGRFGGPSPEPPPFPAADWLYVTAAAVLLPIVGLVIVIRRVRRRRRRRRATPLGRSASAP